MAPYDEVDAGRLSHQGWRRPKRGATGEEAWCVVAPAGEAGGTPRPRSVVFLVRDQRPPNRPPIHES